MALVLAFLAGQLVSPWVAVGTPAVLPGAVGLLLGVVLSRARGALALRLLGAAALGMALASRALAPPGGCFRPGAEGAEKHWIEGVVEEAAIAAPDRGAIVARASVVRGDARRAVCGRLLVTLIGEGAFPEVGERFRLHAHLRRPRSFANPGAEDHVGALARRGIFVTAFAKWTDDARRGRARASLPSAIGRVRARLATAIAAAVPGAEGAFLRAVVLGDGRAVPDHVRADLVAAGLAHLLAVSGLHVGAVWGVVFTLVNVLLGRSETLLLRTHVRAIAAAVALVPAAAYGILAGGRAPTGRAVWMIALFALALAAGREVAAGRVVALAAGALAAVSPGAPLDVSWQLSFAAVAGIVAGLAFRPPRATPVSRARERLEVLFLVPAFAFFATAPLTAFHFGRISLAGLVTNPVLVPLAGVPATILGLLGAALVFVSEEASIVTLRLAAAPASWLLDAAARAAAVPLASVHVPTPTVFELGLLYVAVFLPAVPRERRRRVVAGLLLLATADAGFWIHERFLHRDLRVRFLDVGQGDAAIVELPGGEVLVVDGGGFARSRFDVGERVIAPWLRRRKILRLDALVVTHADQDHQGGLHALAREFSPRELWRSADPGEAGRLRELEEAVRAARGRVRVLGTGTRLRRGGVVLEVLHPPRDEPAASANDASLVLRLAHGRTSVLLAGDVEAAAEARLLARGLPAADVLKIPHHGSRTSSSRAFVDAIRPKIAIVSAAGGNRYGHPHAEVLARYRKTGTRILRTDRDGSVVVSSDGERIRVRTLEQGTPVACDLFGVLC